MTPKTDMAEGQPYPTVAMLKMMKRRNELEEKGDETEADKMATLQFQTDYLIKTDILFEDTLMKVIVLYRIHLEDTREGTNVEKKMIEIDGLMQFVSPEEDINEIRRFYNTLTKRLITGRHVFYGVLKDDKTAIPFDLKEDQNKFRLITTKECGSCGQAFVPLFQCKICKKAAYCNQACQKEDFKFHKLFCKDFAKEL